MSAEDLAAELLEQVRRQAGPGAEAVVRVEDADLALTRFAGSAIHQNTAESRRTLHLQLTVDGGRTAAASTTRARDAAGLVEATLAAARLRPRDPAWPGPAGPAPLVLPSVADRATAEADPALRARLVGDFVAAAGGLSTAGYVQTSAVRTVLATSAGQHVGGSATAAACDGIARLPGSDGTARQVAAAAGELDCAALGARAAAKARAGTDPSPVDPGRWPVVLEPPAVADVVAGLLTGQFQARAALDGTGGLRPGEQQFDPAVSLTDPAGLGLPFDTEGTPKRPVELVRAGVPVGLTSDRRTAEATGGTSTGHGGPASATWGPVATDAALAPGTGGSVDDLVAGLERGLLVTDVWYTRVLDQKRSVWTGLTRNGVWLVEDGRVVRPVSTLRFTQSYLEALAPGAVTVGSDVQALPRTLTSTAWGTHRVAVPALALASWNITGNAAG
ncbi:metallopeptidase TldD-related protein [Klenkia taihuensis]|uniref:Predicted Zn-dependent protease or its inactivated homolog n=1 Tax=Klenkia taihuensis TaxID=1225127 RepID=A0A1I1MDX2_9ACTN|nr:metallopeptidase TldD-related protein [Klenkia taihuensis]GHE14223.1 hypothetical protein GCM10011381_39880 [Klenkia taihuensis]SFC83617.1 Predicted Zn-dependent protease or its inactivated homolog [Klenkia taihuensis]